MNPEIRKDILKILDKSFIAINNKDIISFTELSDHINHNASIFQDEDAISIAVLIYSLGKIFYREERIDLGLVEKLKQAREFLLRRRYKEYRDIIRRIIHIIKQRDKKMGFYITHILDKAGIKKGTKLVYNGISLARVAYLMGVSQWEMINYLGKTMPSK